MLSCVRLSFNELRMDQARTITDTYANTIMMSICPVR